MTKQKPFGPATAYANNISKRKVHEINIGQVAKNYKTSYTGNIKVITGHEATIYKIIKHGATATQYTLYRAGNKNSRETTSALEPHNILTRPRSNRFSEIELLLLVHARQSQETRTAVKQNFRSGATELTRQHNERTI